MSSFRLNKTPTKTPRSGDYSIHNSVMRSPTGISHANELAKGSADLKEQLRMMWEAQENIENGDDDDDDDSGGKNVARDLAFNSDDEDEGEEEEEEEGGNFNNNNKTNNNNNNNYDETLNQDTTRVNNNFSPAPSLAPTTTSNTKSADEIEQAQIANAEKLETINVELELKCKTSEYKIKDLTEKLELEELKGEKAERGGGCTT